MKTALTLRLDAETYDKLRAAAYERRVSHQQALADGLHLWLDQAVPNTPVRQLPTAPIHRDNEELHQRLDAILAGRDHRIRRAVEALLAEPRGDEYDRDNTVQESHSSKLAESAARTIAQAERTTGVHRPLVEPTAGRTGERSDDRAGRPASNDPSKSARPKKSA